MASYRCNDGNRGLALGDTPDAQSLRGTFGPTAGHPKDRGALQIRLWRGARHFGRLLVFRCASRGLDLSCLRERARANMGQRRQGGSGIPESAHRGLPRCRRSVEPNFPRDLEASL